MISLSKGFMMYSLAPALSASWIWARSFSVVQNTTLGASPPDILRSRRRKSIPFMTGMFQSSRIAFGISRGASLHRLFAVLGLRTGEVQLLQDLSRHLADNAAVIDDKTGFHTRPRLWRKCWGRGYLNAVRSRSRLNVKLRDRTAAPAYTASRLAKFNSRDTSSTTSSVPFRR